MKEVIILKKQTIKDTHTLKPHNNNKIRNKVAKKNVQQKH